MSEHARAGSTVPLDRRRHSHSPASASLALTSERAIVFASLAGLVLVLWIPFGPRNGLGYETAFPYMSETQSWWDGFFYRADPLRIYTSVFYNASYLLGRAAGVTGSFVPYQIVYAVLWLGRGVLTYEIVKRLVPRAGLLPYLAGVLVLVHASDGALNWVGQMNQFGMMFWLLLSVYLLVLAVTVESTELAAVWCVLSMVAVRLCLWSYESGLGLVLLAPAIVLFARRGALSRARVLFALLYYVPAAYYIALNVQRYAEGDGSTYQESVSRSDLELLPMLRDLVFNVRASVQFWDWGDSPPTTGLMPVVVGLAGAGLVIIGGAAVSRLHAARHAMPDRRSTPRRRSRRGSGTRRQLPRVHGSRICAEPVENAVPVRDRVRRRSGRSHRPRSDTHSESPPPRRRRPDGRRRRDVFRRRYLLQRRAVPLCDLGSPS